MKKRRLLILAIEILIMIAAIIFCRSLYENNKIEKTYLQEDITDLSNDSGGVFYLDAGMDDFKNLRLGINNIELPVGSYNVTLYYQSHGTVHTGVSYCNGRNLYDISGDVHLNEQETHKSFEININMANEPVCLFTRLNSESVQGDYVLIDHATITSTSSWYKLRLFDLLLLMIIIDACLWIYFNRDNISISDMDRKVLVSICGIIVFASIPLFADYLISGNQDIAFHLARIEGIKDGLMAGEFPVRIQPQWLNGNGYPVSVFYGDVLLYFPALLRIAGISLENSYKAFVFAVNIATAVIAYRCFSKISEDKKTGIVASAFYTLNLYRITNLYVRAAVGEYCAIMFFPIIMYGLWFIFTKNKEQVRKSKIWILLSFGYLGLLYTHLISCEIAAIFTVIVCIVHIRSVFKKDIFLTLCKTVAGLAMGGVSFIIPFLQYLQLGFSANNLDRFVSYRQEERGLFWNQFFITKYNVNAQSVQTSLGMAGEMPLTLGLSFLILLFAVTYVCVCNYKTIKNKRQWITGIVFLALSMWICTDTFPFAGVADISNFFKLLVNSLQYPWRFLVLVILISTFLLTIVLQTLDEKKKEAFIILFCGVLMINSMDLMSDVINTNSVNRYFSEGDLDSFGVSGGEYLYENADTSDYTDSISDIGAGVIIDDSKRMSNEMVVNLKNTSASEQTIEIPLILYKGYKANDINTGKELYISDGKSHRIKLHIPVGYEGEVDVKFREPWYWRIAELISLISLLSGVIMLFKDKREDRV